MLFDLESIDFAYPDGSDALRNVSLCIAEGENVALLGANGSGKSTLLRLLNGLQFAHKGVVLFRGGSLTERALQNGDFRKRFRQSVGFVFQLADAQLFNATVFEEIAFGPRQLGLADAEARDRTNDTLRFLGIDHLADRPPFRLSGGEKRKVAIASVLSMNPDVLMLDEPFLGLDPRGQTWLARTLQQLQLAGKTTIVATHTLDMVPRIASRAVVLGESHEVLADGPISDIFADDRLLIMANLIEDAPAEVAR